MSVLAGPVGPLMAHKGEAVSCVDGDTARVRAVRIGSNAKGQEAKQGEKLHLRWIEIE